MLGAAERWLLPGVCLLCDRGVGRGEDALVCSLCQSRWVRIPEPVCARCGQPVEPEVACRTCVEWPQSLTAVRSAVWLDGSARQAVHHLKYGGWWRAAHALAAVMRGLDPLRGATALVPVPLGRARRRARSYNQAERVAMFLGRLTGVPVRDDLLRRVRETGTQTRLTPEEREANLVSAFDAGGRMPRGPLVLVDDVFTTGSTVVAAASGLLGRGALEVRAVTFARARRPLDDDVSALTAPSTRQEETP